MKLHAAAQMKHVGGGIGSFPFFRQVAVRNPMSVQFDQAVENQAVDSLGLSIGPDSRVQISRHRFDQEIDDAGIGFDRARAGGEYKEGEEKGSKGD
jgi:hypothetical protein